MTRAEKIRAGMLAAGLSSDLADQAIDHNLTLSKLRRASTSELAECFSEEDAALVKERLQRRKIAADVVFRLLDESNSQCCICWNFSSHDPIIFHHIHEHSLSANDSYDNLVVLCLNHHALAHTRSALSRPSHPPEIIRKRKREWIEAVTAHRKGDRVAPGSEATQAYHPVPRPPAVRTRVVGRTHDSQTICEILGTHSRVALWGMGGVGKTVLGLHIANVLTDVFPGGVLWGSLGEYSGDATALLKHWGRLCGADLPEIANTAELADTLRNRLVEYTGSHGRQLIVVDDARIDWIHEIHSLARVAPPDAAFLITTRDRPVAVSLNCQVVELDVLDSDSALDLLDDHAGGDIRQLDADAAKELLRLLGNLPLAVELLGKHIAGKRRKPGFALTILVTELRKERLNRLNLPGHPALTAVFALSYGSLSQEQQRYFRHAGIFSTILFTGSHLAAILQAPPRSVEESLDYLVGTSLLAWTDQVGVYRLHPLLHEYAIALLRRKKTEAQHARSAHFSFFAGLVSKRSPKASAGSWEQYLPELIHGIKSVGREHPEVLLTLADDLWVNSGLLGTRGYYREAVVLLEAAALAAKRLGRLGVAAAHIGNLGAAFNILGENAKARHCYNRALSITETMEDQFDRPAFLGNLGMLLQQEGDWRGAQHHYKAALEGALAVGNFDTALNQFNNLGSLMRHRDPAVSHEYYKAGSRLAKKVGNTGLQAAFLSNLGLLHFDAGNYDLSEKCIRDALELAKRLGDRKAEANRLGHLGNLAVARGKHSEAISYFEEAVAINHAIGYKSREADWLSNLGFALWHTGDKPRGLALVRDALQLSVASGHAEAEGLNHLRLAEMLRDQDIDAAASHFAAARALLGSIESPIALTELS